MIDQNIFNVNIKNILDKHKIEYTKKDNIWLQMSCLFPDHNDNNPSFFINIDSKAYNCFSCNRHGKLSDLFKQLGWSSDLGSPSILVGVPPSRTLAIGKNRGSSISSQFTKMPIPQGFTRVDLGKPSKYLVYLKSRKLDPGIDMFKISYTVEKDRLYGSFYKNRIIIPIHDPNGRYLFCEGRTIKKNWKPKYYRPPKVQSKKILFNQHRCKKFDYTIVVEGILDAVFLYTHGYSSVCCFGASLSTEQIALLTNFDKVYLCFDIDKAGIEGYVKARKMIIGLGIEIYRQPARYQKLRAICNL